MSRIVLLEDDTFSALALTSLLEEEGFEVQSYESSDTALEGVEQWIPDVLIADWSIEGSVTSDEVARRLRALNPSMRIFFVTGYDSDDIREQVRDLDPCEVFAKPLDFDQFLLEIKHKASSLSEQPLYLQGQPASKEV